MNCSRNSDLSVLKGISIGSASHFAFINTTTRSLFVVSASLDCSDKNMCRFVIVDFIRAKEILCTVVE